MLQTLVNNNIQDTFPNMYICLRIYLLLLVANCSWERSFSALKRVKNYLRSTLSDQKLNHLALMHIESSVLRNLKLNDILDNFVNRLSRKMFKEKINQI